MRSKKCLAIALLLSCATTVHADDRLPIPDVAAQKEADALVKEIFGDEIAKAKTPDEKSAFIKKLLEESATTGTSPEGRYSILKAALDVAPDAGVAMSVIENMAKQFRIDELNAKAYTIKKISDSVTTHSERKALAESAVRLMDRYVEMDNFDAALVLGKTALSAATRSKDSQLLHVVQEKNAYAAALQKQYADVKVALATLATNPVDAKSNLTVGKYKCFGKSEWEDGLPMLALGDDEGLKKLASQELRGPTTSNEQVALADGWYDLAQKSGEGKDRMLQRAAYWYKRCLQTEPQLSGLLRKKVETRSDELSQLILATNEIDNTSNRAATPKRPSYVPDTAVHWNGNWYWFSDYQATIDAAQSLAKKSRSRLVVISSAEENTFVASHIQGGTFLGIFNANGIWVNALNTQQRIFFWDRGQPSSGPTERLCVIHPKAKWHDHYVTDKLYVCLEWGDEK